MLPLFGAKQRILSAALHGLKGRHLFGDSPLCLAACLLLFALCPLFFCRTPLQGLLCLFRPICTALCFRALIQLPLPVGREKRGKREFFLRFFLLSLCL